MRFCLETPLGPITLEAQGHAVIAAGWGGEPSSGAPTGILRNAEEQTRAYFAGSLTDFHLPLAARGSPFDQRVWKAIAAIPYGATETYGSIAKRLGTSPRGVGGACGRNPIALVVPCHRVVGAAGRLTGYSGGAGLATKRALLDHEVSIIRSITPGHAPQRVDGKGEGIET